MIHYKLSSWGFSLYLFSLNKYTPNFSQNARSLKGWSFMRGLFGIHILSFTFENKVLKERRSLMREVAHDGFHCISHCKQKLWQKNLLLQGNLELVVIQLVIEKWPFLREYPLLRRTL